MNRNRFEGKIALVTGGNSGIGLAAAKAFAREGAKAVITGRDPKTIESAAREIGEGTLALRCDTRDLNQIDAVMAAIKEKHGRLDVLFANAGVADIQAFDKITEEQYDYVIDINLKGTFFTVQKAVPLMPMGSAIVLNSSNASTRAFAEASVYCASKAGVVSLGKTLAAALVTRGIRVNVCSPGPIDTPIAWRMPSVSKEQIAGFKEFLKGTTLRKQIGTPEEAVAPVLFLASGEASNIIGIDVVVDGGANVV